jgi:hypothetical protein
MILGFKTQFPWGEPTHFEEKILRKPGFVPKIHTLRESDRFEVGQKIHFATGVRTKHYRQFYEDTIKSKQQVIIVNIPSSRFPFVYVDGKRLNGGERAWFVLNDGFDSVADFARWFKQKDIYVLTLNHWTDKKY